MKDNSNTNIYHKYSKISSRIKHLVAGYTRESLIFNQILFPQGIPELIWVYFANIKSIQICKFNDIDDHSFSKRYKCYNIIQYLSKQYYKIMELLILNVGQEKCIKIDIDIEKGLYVIDDQQQKMTVEKPWEYRNFVTKQYHAEIFGNYYRHESDKNITIASREIFTQQF